METDSNLLSQVKICHSLGVGHVVDNVWVTGHLKSVVLCVCISTVYLRQQRHGFTDSVFSPKKYLEHSLITMSSTVLVMISQLVIRQHLVNIGV